MLKKLLTEDYKTKLSLTAILMVLGFTYNWDLVNWPERIVSFPLVIFEGWEMFFLFLALFCIIYFIFAILKYLIQIISRYRVASKQAWIILIATFAILGTYYILNHQLIIHDLHNGPHSSEGRYSLKSNMEVTVDSLNFNKYVWESKEHKYEIYIMDKTLTFENDSTYVIQMEQRFLDWLYLPRLLFDLNLKAGKRITIFSDCEENNGGSLCFHVSEVGKADTNQAVTGYQIVNEDFIFRLREKYHPGHVLVYRGAFWIYDNHLYSFRNFDEY